jgi:hypothetical protein
MFDEKFSEGKHNEATLKVIEGVVSLQSFEMLLQWLYIGQITFYSADPGVQIDAAIELARLADMCAVHALEAATAKIIKKTIIVTAEYARRGYKGILTRTLTQSHLITSSRRQCFHRDIKYGLFWQVPLLRDI